jgi:hypothetical protein
VPTEARAALAAGLAHGGPIGARGAVVLFLLDPDPVVRRAVAGALAGVASTLSPTEVRRLIAVRNWRPIDERTEVDAIIRKARGWRRLRAMGGGQRRNDLATAVDGSVARGFLLVSPAGRKKRISSIRAPPGTQRREGNYRPWTCSRLPRRSAAPTGNLRS